MKLLDRSAAWLLAVAAFAAAAAPQDPATQDPAIGQGVDGARLARVGALLRGEVERGDCAGASWLVWHGGEVVAADTAGVRDVASGAPMQADTIVRIYSMTKVVTALAVLQLHEQGRLQLGDEAVRWLPELRDLRILLPQPVGGVDTRANAQPITVRMLLNHTAGFSYGFRDDDPIDVRYRAADLWAAESLDAFVQKVAALPLASEPGTEWRYSIADDLLGAVVERVSGEPFAAYVRAHLCGPLGMVDTDFDVPDGKRARLAALATSDGEALKPAAPILGAWAEPGRGFAAGGAGLFSTRADWLRLCRMLLGGGALDGVRVLGRKTLELAARNSLTAAQGGPAPGVGWGLFCAVRIDTARAGELGSDGMLYWSGAATTHFVVDPQEQLIAVLLCQHVPYDQHRLLPRFRAAVYQALR